MTEIPAFICLCFWSRQFGTWQEGGDSNGRRGGEREAKVTLTGGAHWVGGGGGGERQEVKFSSVYIDMYEFDENFFVCKKKPICKEVCNYDLGK